MTEKVFINSICGKCVHVDVCSSIKDNRQKCGFYLENRPQGEWNILQKDDNGIHEIECPFCKYSKGGRFASIGVTFHKLPPFCEACGAVMRKELKHKACYNCKHYCREPLGEHRPRLIDNYCDIDKHDISSGDFYFHICDKWEEKEGDEK